MEALIKFCNIFYSWSDCCFAKLKTDILQSTIYNQWELWKCVWCILLYCGVHDWPSPNLTITCLLCRKILNDLSSPVNKMDDDSNSSQSQDGDHEAAQNLTSSASSVHYQQGDQPLLCLFHMDFCDWFSFLMWGRGVVMMKWCLMSSDVSWHIRDKLWPMPKHGSIILYVHRNQKAR